MNETEPSTAAAGGASDSGRTLGAVAVSAEISSLKSRMLALESEAAGYVRVHVVYFVAAICLIGGMIAGHIFR